MRDQWRFVKGKEASEFDAKRGNSIIRRPRS